MAFKPAHHRPFIRELAYFAAAASMLGSLNVSAQTVSNACLAQAETQLEQSYCKIRQAGGAVNVRSIAEFKNNPENVQRLLLKRDAARLGISLPDKQQQDIPQTNSASTAAQNQPSLTGCSLIETKIQCGSDQYLIVGNLKNNQLKAEAFSSHNQLELPDKNSSTFKDDSDYRYLSHIYPMYIHKMLELGLGDSTMSFTKFAAVYWQNKLDGLDFVERFRAMYNKLKIEKSRNQIQSRYRDNYPKDIEQCMRLDKKIIVCDDKLQNWVYRRR